MAKSFGPGHVDFVSGAGSMLRGSLDASSSRPSNVGGEVTWRQDVLVVRACCGGAAALFAVHHAEERSLRRASAPRSPAWLLLGVVFQLGTYVADARRAQGARLSGK